MTKKVIIIDDSLTQLNILKSAFAKNFWEVFSAQNAKAGLELIYEQAPDLVITDAIMPQMGGFQLIKTIRQDEKISKIPVIIYSVLSESNAKFYMKEELSEHFLRKNDNTDELIAMADNVILKYPLEDSYKFEILKASAKKQENQIQTQEIIIEDTHTEDIDPETIKRELKQYYDFSKSDEKILENIFSILHGYLDYNLCCVQIYSFEKKSDVVYFDIKDILLSPIFQNNILKKYNTKESVLYKKYTPNMKMIVNEEEFSSKLEFSFEYKEKPTANIEIWAKEKQKWQNTQNIDSIRYALEEFFSARHINKNSQYGKNHQTTRKYFGNLDFAFTNKIDSQKKENIYFGIISITNFYQMKEHLDSEETDIINSKISEKIISFLDKNEQVYKSHENEYNIIISAKDEKQALFKFNSIVNLLDTIFYDTYKVDAIIGACSCNFEDGFNIYEAQKIARNTLDNISDAQKVVIGNAE